jgi:uncharacterized delta-60 repeat protein
MWFLSRSKVRHQLSPSRQRERFRPRLEKLEDRCLLSALSAGILDSSFGTGGLVTGAIRAPYSPSGFTLHYQSWYHVPVVVYPNTGTHLDTDNKILAGGFVLDPVTKYQDFAIARYNSDGSLDDGGPLDSTPGDSFGTGGVAYTSVGVTSSDLFALAIDANRNIVAVGAAAYQRLKAGGQTVDDEAVAVVRFTSAGVLDTSFNPTPGAKHDTIVTNVTAPSKKGDGGTDLGDAVAIDPNGSIVVAAISNSGSYDQFTLLRYTSTGILDPSFGKSGIVITPTVGNTWNDAQALAIQLDGKILLAGYAGSGMAVARYNSNNGSPDTSFGSSGIVSGLVPPNYTSSAAFGVLIQNTIQDPNGFKIVLAGTANNSYLALARLSSVGVLDKYTGFGGANNNTGFYVNSNVSSAFSLLQAPNGDLLAGGSYPDNSTDTGGLLGVAAFLPNGTPDTSFGSNGAGVVTTPPLGGAYARGRGIALQSDGKIVLAGFTAISSTDDSNDKLALAGFLPPANTFTVSPTSVSSGSNVTLFASNIVTPWTISSVSFYLESNNDNNTFDLADMLLGTVSTNTNGTWSLTIYATTTGMLSGTPLAPGAYTFYAQATDGGVNVSVPLVVAMTVTV